MSTFLDFTYQSVRTAVWRYFEPLRWVAEFFRRIREKYFLASDIPDIAGQWSYRCTVLNGTFENGETAFGGSVLIRLKKNKFGYSIVLQGQDEWRSDSKGREEKLSTHAFWECSMGSFASSDIIHYLYSYNYMEGRREKYAKVQIINPHAPNEMRGELFYPGSPIQGKLQFQRKGLRKGQHSLGHRRQHKRKR